MHATASRAPAGLQRAVALAVLVLAMVCLHGVRAADAQAVVPADGEWFSPSSIWNSAIAPDAALDPASPDVVAHLKAAAVLHATINTTQYSVPVYRVGPGQPTVRVTLTSGNAPLLQAAVNAVPMPPDAQGASGTDGAAVVYQASSDTAWEFFHLRNTLTGFKADYAGRILNVSTHIGYFRDLTDAGGSPIERWQWGITAPKLARLGGLITADEMRAGLIDHALAIAVPQPRSGVFAFPAQKTDGTDPSPDAVPEGAHFRLDPTLDVESLKVGPITKMLARAAQTYGLIVNNGTASAVAFVAEDPKTLAFNPYPALFGGKTGAAIAKAFPWGRLQLLQMDLRTQPHPLA